MRAARLWGAAHGLRRRWGGDERVSHLPYWKRQLEATRAWVDEETWDAAWSEGSAMTDEEAIAYALEETPSLVTCPVGDKASTYPGYTG